MNQNSVIETIREAIGILNCVYDDNKYDRKRIISAAATLCDLANELEAALQQSKEQPPVEQSEPKSGVWIDGEWREIRVSTNATCPHCNFDFTKTHKRYHPDCEWMSLGWNQNMCFWLAPPAVIEPEPELDEFEAWATERRGMSMLVSTVLEKYREIISRKGDK